MIDWTFWCYRLTQGLVCLISRSMRTSRNTSVRFKPARKVSRPINHLRITRLAVIRRRQCHTQIQIQLQTKIASNTQGPSLRDISRAKGNLKGVGSPTTSQVSVEYGHSVLVRSGIWHFEAWVGKGRESRVYRFGMGKEHG